jgi:hypothetical protein
VVAVRLVALQATVSGITYVVLAGASIAVSIGVLASPRRGVVASAWGIYALAALLNPQLAVYVDAVLLATAGLLLLRADESQTAASRLEQALPAGGGSVVE